MKHIFQISSWVILIGSLSLIASSAHADVTQSFTEGVRVTEEKGLNEFEALLARLRDSAKEDHQHEYLSEIEMVGKYHQELDPVILFAAEFNLLGSEDNLAATLSSDTPPGPAPKGRKWVKKICKVTGKVWWFLGFLSAPACGFDLDACLDRAERDQNSCITNASNTRRNCLASENHRRNTGRPFNLRRCHVQYTQDMSQCESGFALDVNICSLEYIECVWWPF
jgi:hypothetical protein